MSCADKMSRLPELDCNPTYVAVETDDDQDDMEEVDPVYLTPFMSCSALIVTAPASDDGEEIEDGDDGGIEGLFKVMWDALGNIEQLDRGLRDLTSPFDGAQVSKSPLQILMPSDQPAPMFKLHSEKYNVS